MPHPPLQHRAGRHLSVIRSADQLRLRFAGELDVARIDEIQRQVTAALAEGHRSIAVDLGEVTFMDCATIGTLVGCAREAAAAGAELVIATASTAARRVIDLTGTGETLGLSPAA